MRRRAHRWRGAAHALNPSMNPIVWVQAVGEDGGDAGSAEPMDGVALHMLSNPSMYPIMWVQAEGEDGEDAGGAEPMDGVAPSAAAPAGGQAGEGVGAAAAEPATDQWVQCDRCRTWRIVPDSEWPKVEADPRDVRPLFPIALT